MKKKNLLISASLALGIGVGVFAGIGLHNGVAEVDEVKAAAEIASVTLKGTFDSWASGVSFAKQSNGDYTLSYALAANDEFKIVVTGGDTEWVGYSWGVPEANIEYEFVGEGSEDGNFKALSSYTLNFTVKSTFYTNYKNDVYISLGEERTVELVDTTGVVFAGTEELNEELTQFSGLITTLEVDSKFRIKDTIGSSINYYAAKEDSVTVASIDNVGGNDYFKIPSTGTYTIYFKKNTHLAWIGLAETGAVAYQYAAYFNNHIGCDPDGIDAPTGWTTCANRYKVLSGDVKDYIYDAESNWKENDDLYHMIQTYNWAINHNPNTLSHFIVNRSDVARDVPAGSGVVSTINNNGSSNTAIVVTVTAASIALLGTAGFFLLRRRKEN